MSHAYLSEYVPAFPKPKDENRGKEKHWIKIFSDGREVLNTKTAEGSAEYHRRKWQMWERQGRRCCFEGFIPECPGSLSRAECSFEHEGGRGSGGSRRDDRIEVEGLWQNGAAHLICNGIVGSRHIEYNKSIQARMAANGNKSDEQ